MARAALWCVPACVREAALTLIHTGFSLCFDEAMSDIRFFAHAGIFSPFMAGFLYDKYASYIVSCAIAGCVALTSTYLTFNLPDEGDFCAPDDPSC